MSMNATPSGERVHIGFFGRRNAGKSSVVNAFTGQELSVVSEVKGTTTDPVLKSMELLPLGPVVIMDNPRLRRRGGPGRAAGEKDKAGPQPGGLRRAGGGRHRRPHPRGPGAARPVPGEEPALPDRLQQKRPGAAPGELEEPACWSAPKPGRTSTSSRSGWPGWWTGKAPNPTWWRTCSPPGTWWCWWCPSTPPPPRAGSSCPQQQTIRDILEARAVSVVTGVEELPQTLQSLGKAPPAGHHRLPGPLGR